jgi:putative phosphoesterase
MRIGLISDTHGLLRPEALDAMRGMDRILHAGDIGGAAVLDALATLAPLDAVRGNNDHGPWADALPERTTLDVAGLRLHLLHDVGELDVDTATGDVRIVVAGHSHRPRVHDDGRVLWINPGSAGPRRFSLPVTVAELIVDRQGARARIVPLAVAPARRAGPTR